MPTTKANFSESSIQLGEQVYLDSLNSPEFQEDIQSEIKTEEDKKGLFQQQDFEIKQLCISLKSKISKFQREYNKKHLATKLEKHVDELQALPTDESLKSLYFRHITLNLVNEEIIYMELAKIGSYFPNKCNLAETGITRFPAAVLKSQKYYNDFLGKNNWDLTDTISLRNNSLSLLPQRLFNLPKLQKLGVFGNHIYKLPDLTNNGEQLFYNLGSVYYDGASNFKISKKKALGQQKLLDFHDNKFPAIEEKKTLPMSPLPVNKINKEKVEIKEPVSAFMPNVAFLKEPPKNVLNDSAILEHQKPLDFHNNKFPDIEEKKTLPINSLPVDKINKEKAEIKEPVSAFMPSFALSKEPPKNVSSDSVINKKSLLMIDTTLVRQSSDQRGTFSYYPAFLITKTGEKIEQTHWPVDVKQYGEIGDIQFFDGSETTSLKSSNDIYKRLVTFLSTDLDTLRNSLKVNSSCYEHFDCQKFSYYLNTGEEGNYSCTRGNQSFNYREDKSHLPYHCYEIKGQKESFGKNGVYSQDDLSLHHYVHLTNNVFVSKYGTLDVQFASYQHILDAYVPEEYTKGIRSIKTR